MPAPVQLSFNSTMVRLKAGGVTPVLLVGNCFNSTMVRLKAVIIGEQVHGESFNSTMVRLKAEDPNYLKWIDQLFQFHNGSIKSISTLQTSTTTMLFQFHNGSIKSVIVSGTSRLPS